MADYDIAANLSGAGSLLGALGIYRIAGARWLATAELFLDSGTERIAAGKTAHPTKTYEGRVIEWGVIDKSIPTPAGIVQVSDGKIRINDEDRKWRNLLARQSTQRRLIIIRFMQEGTSEAVADVVFKGEIFNFEFDDAGGFLEIEFRDTSYTWLDQDLAAVITQANFPEFSHVVTGFLPIIAGSVSSKAVPTGYTPGPPEPDPPGLLAAAVARAETIRAEIDSVSFADEWDRLEIGRHRNVDGWVFVMQRRQDEIFSDLFVEFQRQLANGTLVLTELQDARNSIAALLTSMLTRAAEFQAFGAKFSKTIDAYISSTSSWAGTNGVLDYANLLAPMDLEIIRLTAIENSPPVIIDPVVAPQGSIPLPYIGYIETPSGNYDRWGAAIHPLWNVKVLYRKLPTDPVFFPVPIEEYTVNLQNREFIEFPGRTFDCSFIDFAVRQPEDTQIRMDADGFYYRPAWNGLPAVGYKPDDGLTAQGPLRNPADLFMFMESLGLLGTEGVEFDSAGIGALRDICENGTKSTAKLLCDGAQVEPVSRRTFLSQFVISFQFDFLQTRLGKLSIKRIDDENLNRIEIPQSLQLHFREIKAAPTANRLTSSYSRDYAGGRWFETFLGQNSADQLYLGIPRRGIDGEFLRDEDGAIIRTPQFEDGIVELWWTRDPLSAANVTYSRMSYLATGSYRQTIDLPLPEVLNVAELANQIGMTTIWGLQENGYKNVELKVLGLTYNLDQFLLTLRSIHRSPVDIRAAGDKFDIAAGLSGLGGLSAVLENDSEHDAIGRSLFTSWRGGALPSSIVENFDSGSIGLLIEDRGWIPLVPAGLPGTAPDPEVISSPQSLWINTPTPGWLGVNYPVLVHPGATEIGNQSSVLRGFPKTGEGFYIYCRVISDGGDGFTGYGAVVTDDDLDGLYDTLELFYFTSSPQAITPLYDGALVGNLEGGGKEAELRVTDEAGNAVLRFYCNRFGGAVDPEAEVTVLSSDPSYIAAGRPGIGPYTTTET